MSSSLIRSFEDLLGPDALAGLAPVREGVAENGEAHLEIHLASLPRRCGRDFLERPAPNPELGVVDLRGWRRCDLAAALVLEEADVGDAFLEKLYFQGDAEERRMLLRALPFRPVSELTRRLLVEAHRTNDEEIFKAGFADSDLPARALDDDDLARAVLKSAFIDLDLQRLHGAAGRATPELTTMLLEFMSEREAAGRPVWPGSLELGAHAPAPGLTQKIIGYLWSGVDARRLDAARAAAVLDDEAVRGSARERIPLEPVPAIRELLEAAAR